jgi:hypothetical protein
MRDTASQSSLQHSYFRIRENLGSNISHDTDYPDRILVVVFSSFGEMSAQYLKLGDNYHLPHSFQFIIL